MLKIRFGKHLLMGCVKEIMKSNKKMQDKLKRIFYKCYNIHSIDKLEK